MSEDNIKNTDNSEDDGSLAFLKIPRDVNSRSFNCDETTQSKLVNTQFWVVDFIEDVPTRFTKQKGTKGQTLVKIKKNKDSPDSEAKKFFTGSQDILYICKHTIIPQNYESIIQSKAKSIRGSRKRKLSV